MTSRSKAFRPSQLARWTQAAGWEKLLNRKGTTWRQLDAAAQAAVVDAASAQSLMLANAERHQAPGRGLGRGITVGFDAADWAGRV